MATSGSTSVTVTSWDTLKFSWSLSGQSVANNTSTVKWTLSLVAGTYGRISSTVSKDWSVTVNGTTYSGTNKIGISNNSTITLASGTTTIAHNTDGSKTFSYSFSQEFAITFSGSSIGTKSGSGSGTLTTIPRKSTLSVANGTLNTKQTLTVTRQSSSFTHTITYTCGSASGTICTKSTDTTPDFTPPLSLSSQNTTGTTVSITYTITTYNGNTNIGSNSYKKTCSIPSSVKPSCSLSVEDTMGHYSTYGAYIKGQSKLKVTVIPTLAYNSSIKSYSTTVNGVKYTSASFTTEVLNTSGTLTISSTVTDARGRSGTATTSISILDYSNPNISLFKVHRSSYNEEERDYIEDIHGEYCTIDFSASVTPLNDLNTAEYILEYKKTTDDKYTSVDFNDTYKNVFDVTSGHIFPAESGSSYNVRIIARDSFSETIKPTVLSTAEVIEHWRADGKGMGFGKIGEVENGADFGWKIKANEGFINIPIEENTDFNDIIKPNTYVSYDKVASTYINCPVSSGTFKLEVASGGNEGQIQQTLTYTSKTDFKVYHRQYYSGDWAKDSDGNYIWNCVYSAKGNLLWDGGTLETGGYYMTADHTITLSQKVSGQPHGISLVFSYYNGGAKNEDLHSFFIPKYLVATMNGGGHNFLMMRNAFQTFARKYLYIYDDKINGHSGNKNNGTANGIAYDNGAFVLRYVIGV